MLPENILHSDLLDIIFENKNKAYGAYALRKNYNQRLRIALTAVALLTLLFVLMIQGRSQKNNSMTVIEVPVDTMTLIKEIEEPKEIEPLKPQERQVATVDYQTPRIVPDDQVQDTIPTEEEIEVAVISDQKNEGEPVGDVLITTPQNTSNGNETKQVEEAPKNEVPQVLTSAEYMPAFPGGTEAFKRFMLRHLAQPDDLQEGEKVVVIARFIVKNDGTIDEASIARTGRADLDKEVLRVIRKMPNWTPGMQNGRNVSVWFQLPVTFIGEN